jgi:hypothetical protein
MFYRLMLPMPEQVSRHRKRLAPISTKRIFRAKEPCSSSIAARVDVQAINTVSLPVHNCESIDDLGKCAG